MAVTQRDCNLEDGLKDMEDMARNVKSDEELFKLSEQTSMFDVEFKLYVRPCSSAGRAPLTAGGTDGQTSGIGLAPPPGFPGLPGFLPKTPFSCVPI